MRGGYHVELFGVLLEVLQAVLAILRVQVLVQEPEFGAFQVV